MRAKPKIKKTCEICGGEFFVIPSIAHLRKHCSRKCHYSNRTPKLPSLTDRQNQILVGSLLGDGHLEFARKNTHNSRFRKGQKHQFQAYQESLFSELNPYSKTIKNYIKKPRRIGKQTKLYVENETLVYTCSHPVFSELRKKWYIDHKKIVPKDIIITPIVLAYWFCDDGCRGDNHATLYTQGFSKEENEMLSLYLERDTGIKATVIKARVGLDGVDQYALYIGSEQYEKFVELIACHIPWDCLQYKLIVSKKLWKWHSNI